MLSTCLQHFQLSKIVHIWLLPRSMGKAAQDPITEDTTAEPSKDKKKQFQYVVGSIPYYAQSINITHLMALSTIAAAEQSKGTEFIMDTIEQLLITVQCTQMQKLVIKNPVRFLTFTQMPLTSVHQEFNPCCRTLPLWMFTPRQATNKVEWTYVHSHIPPTVCHCFCC